MSTNCPTCGQQMPGQRGRICSLCNKTIRRHDRWYFVEGTVRHKDCSDPGLDKKPVSQQTNLIENETA